MKQRKTKAEKAMDKAIETEYYRQGNGVQISIMDIPKLWNDVRADITPLPDLPARPIEVAMQNAISKYRVN